MGEAAETKVPNLIELGWKSSQFQAGPIPSFGATGHNIVLEKLDLVCFSAQAKKI